MLTQIEKELALRLRPQGYEYVKMDDEAFTRAFISCLRVDTPVTVIMGAGGSGKSIIYKMVAECYGDKALCLAPTGVAANNLETSGTVAHTIHNGLGFPLKPFYDDTEVFAKALSSLSDKKVLLIDEVSMVNANLLDTILRHVAMVNMCRRSAESRVRTILVGDPLQLRPVFDRDKLGPVLDENPGLEQRWDFFCSSRLRAANPSVHVLKTVYRQDDNYFKSILGRIRNGCPTNGDIAYLNNMVAEASDSMMICATNAEVDNINQSHIALLAKAETPYIYDADYLLGDRIRDSGFSDHLEVYVGERVMCTRNCYDDSGRQVFSNGTVGTVIGFERSDDGDTVPVVRSDDGRQFPVRRMEYTDGVFRRHPGTGRLEYVTTASAMQIPIKPCYAVTYHKSQGLTLDSAHLVMPHAVPQPGLMYMGLSRVKSPEGLTISGKVSKEMFRASPEAKQFLYSAEEPIIR